MNNNNASYFPPRDASQEEKEDTKYGLQYAKAIYANYKRDRESFFNQKEKFVRARKYAEGTHDISKFKDSLGLNGDASYVNLDFTPLPIIPKFVDLIVGELMQQEFKVQANAIDDNSLTQFDEFKKDLYTNYILRKLNEEMMASTGVPLVDMSKPVLESEEQIEMYMKETYKQSSEKAIEQGVEFVLSNNDFKEIKRRVIRDFVVLKWGATACYFDSNYDIKIRYCDPRNMVIPYTTKPDCSDLEYQGEVIKMNFHDFRMINRTLDDDDLLDIVKRFGKDRYGYGIDRLDEKGAYYNNGANDLTRFDDFYIEVLDFEFRSSNFNITYEKKWYKEDGFYMNKKKKGYEPNPNHKKKTEIISKDLEVYYDGLWVVGTNYISNYCMRKNLLREKKNEAYSSKAHSRFKIYGMDIYDMQSLSLVERMIPFADQMQLTHLKIQQLIAKSKPQGVLIDVSGLEDVMRGKGNKFMTPLELTEIYDQTGSYYYRGVDQNGTQFNRPPISPAPNGLSSDLERLIGMYNTNLQMIRDVTGINEFRDGTTPNNRTLVGVQKQAISVSRNTSVPLNEAFVSIMNRTCTNVALMLQLKAKYDKNGLKGFVNAIGKETVDILEINKEVSNASLGIQITMLPDVEEMQSILMEIERALQNGNIDLEDALEVRDVLKQSSKQAISLLKERRKKKKEEEEQKSMMLQQQNAQVQMQSTMAAKQAETEMEMQKMKMKQELINLEYDRKIELEMVKAKGDQEEEVVRGQEKLKQMKFEKLMDHDPKEQSIENQTGMDML